MASCSLLAVVVLVLFGWRTIFPETGPSPNPTPPPTAPAAVDFLPKSCEPGEGAHIVPLGADRRRVYNRATYVFTDGTRVEFLLIPQTQPGNPKPFYIMENKVSNKLFRQFAAANPGAVEGSAWTKGGFAGARDSGKDLGSADDTLPVLRVTVVESWHFAQWLGGNLPTARQWDKAAGLYEGAEQPYKGRTTFEKGEFAVDRAQEGPMPVGKASRDISYFGCRDMAGNGREWTRTVSGIGTEEVLVPFPDPKPDLVVKLRGRSYAAPEPLTFAHPPDSLEAGYTLPDIGFRVVLELPADP
jgi:formylglycine-generating enzyme required for sulfatase activity